MATGTEKCVGCKKSPWPQGYNPTTGKCWFCDFTKRGLPLTDAQVEMVREALAG